MGDQGLLEISHPASPGSEKPREPTGPHRSDHGRHVAMRQGANAGQVLIQLSHGKVFQGELDQVDSLVRKAGEIGQGLRTNFFAFPDTAPQEDRCVNLLPMGLFYPNEVDGAFCVIHTTNYDIVILFMNVCSIFSAYIFQGKTTICFVTQNLT